MCTITRMSDLDPVKWPKSQWRNIQVFIVGNICFISCQISKGRVPRAEMLLKVLAVHDEGLVILFNLFFFYFPSRLGGMNVQLKVFFDGNVRLGI